MLKTIVNQKAPAERTLTDVIGELASFDADPNRFYAVALATQCRVAAAAAGALLRVEKGAVSRLLETWPAAAPGAQRPTWLDRAMTLAPAVTERGRIEVTRMDTDADGASSAPVGSLVLVPVRTNGRRWIVGAFHVEPRDADGMRVAVERLQVTSGLLRLRETLLKIGARDQLIDALRQSTEILEALNEQDRFKAAAIALCDEIATRWRGERVSLGFLQGRYVRTVAISHTERFERKMTLVRDLEATMEECFDQDVEIIHPRPDSAVYVSRACEQFSLRHGPMAVASLPFRRKGEPLGVLTIERRLDDPLVPADIEILRMTSELVATRLLELRRNDRWFGARLLDGLRATAAITVGPRHTWKKALAVLAAGVMIFLAVAHGEDRIHSSFEVIATEQRVVAAPFDGRLERVAVEPGQMATAGETVLAILETDELRLERAALLAERSGFIKEADLAMRDRQAVKVQIAETNLQRLVAELELVERHIAEATIVAPIGGTIVSGDLKDRIGAPVATGDELFEIAEIGDLRAELQIPEERIGDLLRKHEEEPALGTLASVSHPGEYIAFTVERIHPMAEVIEQKNVFRVEVRLHGTRPWLRPGMKGVAKINAGQRSYASLLTRRLVNQLRMWLWI